VLCGPIHVPGPRDSDVAVSLGTVGARLDVHPPSDADRFGFQQVGTDSLSPANLDHTTSRNVNAQ